jgi:hypothetical protein
MIRRSSVGPQTDQRSEPASAGRGRGLLRVARHGPDSSQFEGPWPRAVQRFERAVHRFHDLTEATSDRPLRRELERIGETLDSCLADLQAARRVGAREGRETLVVRATHRAATLCAHSSEAALMAGERARRREFEDVIRCVDTIRTLVKAIRELVDTCMIYH